MPQNELLDEPLITEKEPFDEPLTSKTEIQRARRIFSKLRRFEFGDGPRDPSQAAL